MSVIPPKYTIEEYNALCRAINLCVTKVVYADKTVEYANTKIMLDLRGKMEVYLGISQSRSKIIRTQFDRGYER
ncbi:MAG: hypothetical protein Q8861_02020 [Bacteroidota bacterium]|nr:hypothetical protein [Bacteroidota bacterium]